MTDIDYKLAMRFLNLLSEGGHFFEVVIAPAE